MPEPETPTIQAVRRLAALMGVRAMPSHQTYQLPLGAGKAETIGAARPGDRYLPTDGPKSLIDVMRALIGGSERPPSVQAADPMGLDAWEATGELPPMLMGSINAYHGSPHDFDKFSLSKIGTGEGVQAYGHGLYFAEKEGVARSYRDGLASAQRAINPVRDSAHVAAAKDFLAHGYSPAQTLEGLQSAYKGADIRALEAALREARGLDGGRMYEVRINADPEQMLDWDARIEDQPQAVRDALKRNPYFNEMGAGGTGHTVYNELQTVGADRSGIPARTPSAASAELQRIGIPGIKYFDGGSRGPSVIYDVGAPRADFGPYSPYTDKAQAEKQLETLRKYGFHDAEIKVTEHPQSRNYVIFDDSLIDILKKYGVALPVIEGLRRTAAANGGTLSQQAVDTAIQQ